MIGRMELRTRSREEWSTGRDLAKNGLEHKRTRSRDSARLSRVYNNVIGDLRVRGHFTQITNKQP